MRWVNSVHDREFLSIRRTGPLILSQLVGTVFCVGVIGMAFR